jgi:hypothetical protein
MGCAMAEISERIPSFTGRFIIRRMGGLLCWGKG